VPLVRVGNVQHFRSSSHTSRHIKSSETFAYNLFDCAYKIPHPVSLSTVSSPYHYSSLIKHPVSSLHHLLPSIRQRADQSRPRLPDRRLNLARRQDEPSVTLVPQLPSVAVGRIASRIDVINRATCSSVESRARRTKRVCGTRHSADSSSSGSSNAAVLCGVVDDEGAVVAVC
jgi:hypothetical protein